MELRQLEYFCALNDQANFTRAAQALHVSQPSVTKAIKSLEKELNLTLIHRGQKQITLTEEGRTFLLHARRILGDVTRAERDLERFHQSQGGTVHFGIPPMVEGYLFPDLFTRFSAEHQGIYLDVQEFNDSVEIRKRADLGGLDFGIVLSGESSLPNEMVIMEDTLSLCLPKGHRLARADSVTFGELSQEKFIMQQPHTYQYESVYARCSAAGFTPDIILCTSQLKTIKQLVANGVGVSILPDFVTHADTIFCRKRLAEPITVRLLLYWGQHKSRRAVDERFLSFIKSYTNTNDFKKRFRQ